jgi:hypothetical protein
MQLLGGMRGLVKNLVSDMRIDSSFCGFGKPLSRRQGSTGLA